MSRLLGFLLIATLAGFSLPLLPLQILWLELFIDLSTSVAFEREPEEPDAMRRRPRPRSIPLLTDALLIKITAAGGFSAFAALLIMLFGPVDPERARWMAYTVLVVGQAVRAYANRSLTLPVWRLPTNGFLLLAAIATVVIQVVIPYLPAVASAFHAVPLDAGEWLVVLAIAFLPATVAQLVRAVGGASGWADPRRDPPPVDQRQSVVDSTAGSEAVPPSAAAWPSIAAPTMPAELSSRAVTMGARVVR